jgi:uncharacterized membrane protein YkvA (DUF1232 family)
MYSVKRIIAMVRHAGAVFMAKETPRHVKLILVAGLLYIISPYDLIPDWIPVIGVIDDLGLAALLIAWTSKFSVSEKH